MSSIYYIVTSPYYTLEEMHKISNNKSNLFVTVSLNCQSLSSKFDNLNVFVEDVNSNVTISALCLQETWLGENFYWSLLVFNNICIANTGHLGIITKMKIYSCLAMSFMPVLSNLSKLNDKIIVT